MFNMPGFLSCYTGGGQENWWGIFFFYQGGGLNSVSDPELVLTFLCLTGIFNKCHKKAVFMKNN